MSEEELNLNHVFKNLNYVFKAELYDDVGYGLGNRHRIVVPLHVRTKKELRRLLAPVVSSMVNDMLEELALARTQLTEEEEKQIEGNKR